MPLDGLFLYGIGRELNHKLKQGRIEKIYQPGREEIILVISRPGQKYRLLLDAGAENARAHLTAHVRPNPVTPPMFCMLLRKHLEGGRIIEFQQPGLDRVLDIRVECRDELGQPVVKSLVCEIMGRHSNIILVSRDDDTILDGIRRYSHAVSRHREVLPGRTYVPPPQQHKADPLSLSEDYFRELIMAGDLDNSLAVSMQRSLDGFSIPTCRELVRLAGLDPGIPLDHCGEHELRTLWQAVDKTMGAVRECGVRATLVTRPGGDPVDFFPLEVVQRSNLYYTSGGANEIADAFFILKLYRQALAKEKNRLLGIIKKESRRVRKKMALQYNSAADAGEADRYRLFGELLTSYLYLVKRGMREIELVNFYDPEGSTVIIPLDPELNGPENAQAYFKKYNKARNTRDASLRMASLSEEELHYLEGVAASLDIAENFDDLEEIRQELKSQGYLREPLSVSGKKKVKESRSVSLPLKFISSDGFTVLVGKNNRQNDMVTFKLAGDGDIWLHTCKIPGSHVIIRTEGRDVSKQTLLEAASLAAHFSRASGSSNVPVDYTLRKYVKKPAGARPGFVIYDKQKTLYVDPRPDIMQPN